MPINQNNKAKIICPNCHGSGYIHIFLMDNHPKCQVCRGTGTIDKDLIIVCHEDDGDQ